MDASLFWHHTTHVRNFSSSSTFLATLADEYRHVWCTMESARREHSLDVGKIKLYYERDIIASQRDLPSEFLIRVNKEIQEHGIPERANEAVRVWRKEHCFDAHASDEELERYPEPHIEYDECMGWGFHAGKGYDDNKG